MGKKLKRITITGENAREQLEEAKKLVAMLEKLRDIPGLWPKL